MTSKKTRNFRQRQTQKLPPSDTKVETLDLPLESAQEALEEPVEAIQTPPLENTLKTFPNQRSSTFPHLFSSAWGDDARRRS